MVDFRLTETDKAGLARTRAEALVCRKYARYHDENEGDFPPGELPEAAEFYKNQPEVPAPGPEDSSMVVMAALHAAGQNWGDYSVRMRKATDGGLGNAALAAAGTPEQVEKWRTMVLSMAITEPGCGSDPSRVQTTAELDGDEWVINGEKIFVTTGIRAEGVVIWATIDKSAGRAGIKSFLVEKGTPGFDVPHKEKKLGIRADDTAAYVFTDCRIPRENLLGLDESIPKASSGGFRGVMKTFNMTRPMTAAFGLGIADASLDFTREHLEEAGVKIDYGTIDANEPAAAAKFKQLEALYEASMLTTLRACWLAGEGQPNNMESSVCKAHAGSAVRRITQGCIEILGPMGISREHLIEKWMRDCRITDIYEGTGEIQRLIIARGLFEYTRADLN
ncbi:MAG: acyl-CoA dehydrogenase family protein [Myxococcota bacterium]|jgi:acyl-CoA dehydrogenase|nr:acyl-CoA dehydrogenase family protein [Myxococcota bacterium]